MNLTSNTFELLELFYDGSITGVMSSNFMNGNCYFTFFDSNLIQINELPNITIPN